MITWNLMSTGSQNRIVGPTPGGPQSTQPTCLPREGLNKSTNGIRACLRLITYTFLNDEFRTCSEVP